MIKIIGKVEDYINKIKTRPKMSANALDLGLDILRVGPPR